MDAEAQAWAEATRAPWLPRRVQRLLHRVASMVEAASRGRMRQAVGAVVGPLVAAAAWVGSWELLLAIGGHGTFGVVAAAVVAVAMWLVFVTAIAWTFVMLTFLMAGRRWAAVLAAPLLYWMVGMAYVAGGPILGGPSFAGSDLLLGSLTWPVTFLWAELGCGLGLGLCPT